MEKKYEFNSGIYYLLLTPNVGAILAVVFNIGLWAFGLKSHSALLVSMLLMPCCALCIMHFIVQRKKNSYFYIKDDFLCYYDGDTDYKCQDIDTIKISISKIVIIGNIPSISGKGVAKTVLVTPNAYGRVDFLFSGIVNYKNHTNQPVGKIVTQKSLQ